MDWSAVSLPSGSKLFRVHYFTFLHAGSNYVIEVNEFADGTFSGHGEHANDKNLQIEPVNGKNVEECLNGIVKKIENRP